MAHPEADTYKTEKIREDPRVTLLPVEHLTLHPSDGAALTADVRSRNG
ncbi:hypothetical protein [Streptomyces microflavus]